MSKVKKKYELLNDDTTNICGRKLYRIRALYDIGNIVKAGDLGGYVENEINLSHNGECWIHDNAKVFDNARVYGNANIFNSAIVFDNAEVSDYAFVGGCAMLYDNANVWDRAKIYGYARVYGDARVLNNAVCCGHADISGDAKVYEHAVATDHCDIFGNAKVCGRVQIHDNAKIFNAYVHEYATIHGNAYISSLDDYYHEYDNNGNMCITLTKNSDDDAIIVATNNFVGNLSDFKKLLNSDVNIAKMYGKAISAAEEYFNNKG